MKVEMVQIGLTTRCNSNCYFCLRQELTRAGRKEGNVDFPIEGIERILQQGVRDFHFCCNRGEALFHPQIGYIINMVKSSGSRFEMNTNGDRFDTKWWYDLGQKMMPGDQIIFALDGLKNAHEKYRNTNWTNVIKNMRAFIEGGGRAIWQMILFRHNEHQIDLVKKLSMESGCAETWIINSREYNDIYKRPAKKYNKTKKDITINKMPSDIECRFFNGKRVYIDVYGKVWPCCYMKCHFGFNELSYKGTLVKLYENELDFVDVFNTPLDEIVEKSKTFKFIFDHMYDNNANGIMSFNFACQNHCGNREEIDQKNRRFIKNVDTPLL